MTHLTKTLRRSFQLKMYRFPGSGPLVSYARFSCAGFRGWA